jgi:hypothetical protein
MFIGTYFIERNILVAENSLFLIQFKNYILDNRKLLLIAFNIQKTNIRGNIKYITIFRKTRVLMFILYCINISSIIK